VDKQSGIDIHDLLYDFLMEFIGSFNNSLVEPEEISDFINEFVEKLKTKENK